MKIFDFKLFDKLNINPININDLYDEFKEYPEIIRKSDLRTFDIIKFAKSKYTYYMVFCNNDFEKYSKYYSDVKDANLGIFFSYNITDIAGPYCFMKIYLFNEDLTYRDSSFTVTDVWLHPKTYTDILDKNVENLSQEYLKEIINEFHFKHIKL